MGFSHSRHWCTSCSGLWIVGARPAHFFTWVIIINTRLVYVAYRYSDSSSRSIRLFCASHNLNLLNTCNLLSNWVSQAASSSSAKIYKKPYNHGYTVCVFRQSVERSVHTACCVDDGNGRMDASVYDWAGLGFRCGICTRWVSAASMKAFAKREIRWRLCGPRVENTWTIAWRWFYVIWCCTRFVRGIHKLVRTKPRTN